MKHDNIDIVVSGFNKMYSFYTGLGTVYRKISKHHIKVLVLCLFAAPFVLAGVGIFILMAIKATFLFLCIVGGLGILAIFLWALSDDNGCI